MTEHFTDAELSCSCCKVCGFNSGTLARLERVRELFGKPMALSSAYRCPKHNAKVSHTGTHGPHTTGQAVDVVVAGSDALRLIKIAVDCGFTGVGVKQSGAFDSRFIHLDDLGAGYPRPSVWSYP